MLNKKIQDTINSQINAETYSAYLYLSMSAYFESISLKGFANWMRVQAQEELVHAMKFYDYVNERGGRVILRLVEGPPSEWNSPLAVLEHTYRHEQKVTSMIYNLVNLAIEERDHTTHSFLQWFISEQVEEEASANEILQKLKLLGDAPGGLFMLDRDLATRAFTISAEPAQS